MRAAHRVMARLTVASPPLQLTRAVEEPRFILGRRSEACGSPPMQTPLIQPRSRGIRSLITSPPSLSGRLQFSQVQQAAARWYWLEPANPTVPEIRITEWE